MSEEADMELLKELNAKTYKDQAIWFLNAYWTEDVKFGEKEKERKLVWDYCLLCEELDPRGDEGNELDDIKAHQVIEKLGSATTHLDFKALMKTIDLDYNGKVSMTEFLVLHFKVEWKTLVHRVDEQGVDDKLKETEALLKTCQESMAANEKAAELAKKEAALAKEAEAEAKAQKEKADKEEKTAKANEATAVKKEEAAQAAEAKAKEKEAAATQAFNESKAAEEASEKAKAVAEEEAKKAKAAEDAAAAKEKEAVDAEAAAKKAAAAAAAATKEALALEKEFKVAEDEATAAKEEQQKAEDELNAQRKKIDDRIAKFNADVAEREAIKKDDSAGAVAKGKAAHELAILKEKGTSDEEGEKVQMDYLIRKQHKVTEVAEQARKQAEIARKPFLEKREAAEKAEAAAKTAEEEATNARAAAQKALADAKKARAEADSALKDAEKKLKVANAKRAEMEKTKQAAEQSREKAEASRIAAEGARKEAVKSREQAEASAKEAETKAKAAEARREEAEKSERESDEARVKSIQDYNAANASYEAVLAANENAARGLVWWIGETLKFNEKFMSPAQRRLKEGVDPEVLKKGGLKAIEGMLPKIKGN